MKFTIITPTYRGKKFLFRAYQSLCELQSDNEFEWIIVDDYSDDSGRTKNAMEEIKEKAHFPVKLIYLDRNYYGSRSVYEGSSIASGEYGIILDQDDMLKPEALNIFSKYIYSYGSNIDFAGVCGRCEKLSGEFIGTKLKEHAYYSSELIVRRIDKVRGEMSQCTKISLLIEYFRNMKPGYTNGWVWTKIAKKYKFLYIDCVVRVYDTENMDSFTNAGKIRYVGARFEQVFDELFDSMEYLRRDKRRLIRVCILLLRYGLHIGLSPLQIAKDLPFHIVPYLIAAFPIAFLKYANDIRMHRVEINS